MKLNLWASAAAVALVAGGVTVAVAAPAEAHTPSVQATCSTLDVNLKDYAATVPAVPAVYEDVKVIDTPASPEVSHINHVLVTPEVAEVSHIEHQLVSAAVPAVYEDVKVIDKAAVPGVPAVTHVEYQFKHFLTGHIRWETNPNWNAQGNPNSIGWFKTGVTQTVTDKPAVPAQPEVSHIEHRLVSPAKDAVYKDVKVIDTPYAAAVYEDVKVVDSPAVEEVSHIDHNLVTKEVPEKTNHVKVTINGDTKVDTDFSTSFAQSFNFDNKYVANDYSVKVTAWDNKAYNVNESGTTTPCAVPVVDANLKGDLNAGCGFADLTLTNPEAEYTDNKTGAVTVWIDGKFKEAITVAGDATETRHYTFAEDSGDHKVVVKDAEFNGGKVLLEGTVSTDCAPNLIVIDKVTAPTANDVCGTANDTVTTAKGEGYIEEVKWNEDRSEATVKALESEGYTFAEGVKTEWTFKFTNVPCATNTPTPKPTASTPAAAAPAKQGPSAPAASSTEDVLAFTGSNIGPWAAGSALMLLILGGGAVLFARRKKVAPITTGDTE